MSRKYRFDNPGSLHHVMSHSVEGKDIFSTVYDCSDFISRLAENVDDGNLRIHAWVLMGNHFHLLAEPQRESLSYSMKKILTGFALSYNRRNEQKGYVFRSRFKSILVEREKYFMDLVRYIHLNPMRAGVVSTLNELADYKWSGHSAIVGREKYSWQSRALVQFMFQGKEKKWREHYVEYLAEPSDIREEIFDAGNYIISKDGLGKYDGLESPPSNVLTIGILGSREFALEKYNKLDNARGVIKRNRKSQHDRIELALLKASEISGVSKAAIRTGHGNRRATWIRGILVKVLVSELGLSINDTALYFNMSSSGIHRMVQCELEPLSSEIEKIIKQFIE